MNVHRLTLGELDTNCWVVDDGRGGPKVVIDPAGDDLHLLGDLGHSPIAAVVLTHGHFDHLGAAEALLEASGAPLLVHVADGPRLASPEGTGGALFGFHHAALEAERLLTDADVVEAGALDLRVIHTPGHTQGSICLHAPGDAEAGRPDVLFSGDTLFAGSVGRTDFPGGDARALRSSLAKLAALPDDTVVHPGHGPDTTIGRERRINPFWPRG